MLHLWVVYDILTRCNKAVRYIIMAVLIAIRNISFVLMVQFRLLAYVAVRRGGRYVLDIISEISRISEDELRMQIALIDNVNISNAVKETGSRLVNVLPECCTIHLHRV